MVGSALQGIPVSIEGRSRTADLRNALQEHRSRELVFAVVGYAGSGTTFVATQIRMILENQLRDSGFRVYPIKARELLDEYASIAGLKPPQQAQKLKLTEWYQTVGDDMRLSTREHGAVAAYAVRAIKHKRSPETAGKNLFVLDSLKHPGEVELLRRLYGDAFCLIGVGCRPDVRNGRLARKYEIDKSAPELDVFIDRDAEDSEQKHGQQVNRTFHLADYFVDNTQDSTNPRGYTLPDQIKRLFDVLFTTTIRRPSRDERGMYYAHAASMRSSCLSRQVGAAILAKDGTLVAVGANEVPRSGGGSYDEHEEGVQGAVDDRCFVERKVCSNSKVQDDILLDVYTRLSRKELLASHATKQRVFEIMKETRVKSLVEFSRSVHAEMDAIISLARSGTKVPERASLFTTTYPCHNCARHIVAAGIVRLIYLEPYSKSMAIDLHEDSIADNVAPEECDSRVEFLPYQGVSPDLYRRVYLKRGELKDSEGRMLPAQSAEYGASSLWKKAYSELETDVVDFLNEFEEARRHG